MNNHLHKSKRPTEKHHVKPVGTKEKGVCAMRIIPDNEIEEMRSLMKYNPNHVHLKIPNLMKALE